MKGAIWEISARKPIIIKTWVHGQLSPDPFEPASKAEEKAFLAKSAKNAKDVLV
jgi:hypothetical protein